MAMEKKKSTRTLNMVPEHKTMTGKEKLDKEMLSKLLAVAHMILDCVDKEGAGFRVELQS